MSIERQYRLLMWLMAPLVLAHSWRHGRREGEGGYLRRRLGHGKLGQSEAIWLHAASMGEVNAALPLLEAMSRAWPDRPLLLTTTTASGARIARQKLPAGIQHDFLPLDYSGAVARFLDRHRPRCALILETELWPLLYRACAARQIPLLIVNGRLSSRTLRAGGWLRRLYRTTLAHTHVVLARSETDASAFSALGAERVEVIGNIKFAAAPRTEAITPLALGRPYVLAASTREGEEALLLGAWQQLRTAGVALPLLVIAPRHPQRRELILRDLAGEVITVRSRGEAVQADTGVYLADTFGELPALMAGAEWVFMGGSLVDKGGQNLLEPAALGKAVVFGPHMENFRDEARILLEADAAIQLSNPEELTSTLAGLIKDPQRCAAIGQRAQQAVDARREMAERYLAAIKLYCEEIIHRRDADDYMDVIG